MNVPDATIDDIPRHYQCHTVGVSASIYEASTGLLVCTKCDWIL
jgi:phage tail protein X